jgi:hypothetical protein
MIKDTIERPIEPMKKFIKAALALGHAVDVLIADPDSKEAFEDLLEARGRLADAVKQFQR